MARQGFIDELRTLGFTPEEHAAGVVFGYTVPVGRFADCAITLGFQVGDDWPANPPSGPHVSPRLLPLQQGGQHPAGQVMESAFGAEWEYWSRPHPNWPATKRTVRDYLAHIRHLFDAQ